MMILKLKMNEKELTETRGGVIEDTINGRTNGLEDNFVGRLRWVKRIEKRVVGRILANRQSLITQE